MIEESPNVVTEDGLRGLLTEGYLIEVVCKEEAEKRHNSWYGTWVIRAVASDGRDDKMLVTSRSVLKLRDFKTIVGLVSFLADMGCTTVSIPLNEGGRGDRSDRIRTCADGKPRNFAGRTRRNAGTPD